MSVLILFPCLTRAPRNEYRLSISNSGCLSVPGVRGKVSRYCKIKYSGLDRRGNNIERIAEGWHARLVQHEYDHLNGILYPELMNEEDKLLTLEEWKAITA